MTTANSNSEQQQPATTIRTFAELQAEWLDAVPERVGSDKELLDLFILGNRLLLEAYLSGQTEAYGKVAGGRK